MSDKEAALLAAIQDDLESDEPRLVLADWYEEQDELDRAAFIRAQIEASHLPLWDAKRHALTAEADALYEKHKKQWTKALKGSRVREYRFSRGFLDHVVFNGNQSFPHADRVMEDFPTIRSIKLNKIKGCFDDLLKAPWLHRLRILNLTNNGLGARRAKELAQHKSLAGLRCLSLQSNNLGASGIKSVLQSKTLRSLERLSVEHAKLKSVLQLEKTFAGPRLEQLTWFGVGGLEWDDRRLDLVGELVAKAPLPSLKYLRLTGVYTATRNHLPPVDAAAFLESSAFGGLQHLELPELSTEELVSLANHPNASNLRSLISPNFTEVLGQVSADAPLWKSLEFLSSDALPSAEETELDKLRNLQCTHLSSYEFSKTTAALQDRLGVFNISDWEYYQGPFAENLEHIYGRYNV